MFNRKNKRKTKPKTTAITLNRQSYINSIPQRIKDTVSGFVRECDNNIPRDVLNLCLVFYHLRECFTKHGNALILNPRKDIVGNTDYEWNTVYGNILIKSNKPSIYKWTVQILEIHSQISIGIDSSWKTYCKIDFGSVKGRHIFYQYTSDGHWYYNDHTGYHNEAHYSYSSDYRDRNACDSGDYMSMSYHVTEKQIKFYKNNYIVTTLDDVKLNRGYFAVTMGAEGDRVKLVHFEEVCL